MLSPFKAFKALTGFLFSNAEKIQEMEAKIKKQEIIIQSFLDQRAEVVLYGCGKSNCPSAKFRTHGGNTSKCG